MHGARIKIKIGAFVSLFYIHGRMHGARIKIKIKI
jgi:hypothetical protein